MNKKTPILKLKGVSKFYYNKGLVASGFSRISLEFNLGEFVVITGESGSGKSTLLNVLSGLDTYEEGEMYINGEETSHYSDEDIENYRKTYIGNIFQSFNLVNSYTVYQNIELALLLNGFKKNEVKDKIIELIKEVDLYRFRNTKVSKLSGGQKQRVAIARALAKDTPIILADEPTGNLDTRAAKSVIELLSKIAKDKLVIVVTHNYEQVENYATRKIEMHDGKVREDIELRKYEEKEAVIYNFKNITFLNKLRLGIRNTFNIVPKYLLITLVFALITLAFFGVFSSFRRVENQENIMGYNYYFRDTSPNRIVIKKKDKSFISDDDFNKINALDNIKYIEKNDILIDSTFNLNNNKDFWFYGKIKSIDEINSVDVGRMPQNENEIVIEGDKYDYYLSNQSEELFKTKLSFYNDYNIKINDSEYAIVGIRFKDENTNDYNSIFYTSKKVFDEVRLSTNVKYSNLEIVINNNLYKPYSYDKFMNLMPNENVKDGEAFVSNDFNYMCKYEWCRNNKIDIKIKNMYYEDTKQVNITNMYTKYNLTALTGLKGFDDYNGIIFISPNDYNDLYDKNTYQSSVFVQDEKTIDNTIDKLNNMGFQTLKVKDTIVNLSDDVVAVIRIFRVVVIVVLFIVLFLIAYFVIRLIEKSRNVYYATVRILGGTKRVIKSLISIELYNIYHITYIIIMILVFLVKKGLIYNKTLLNLSNFLTIKDYIIIYFIMLLMSILISKRYSRKLFKSSAMSTYREEN